MARVQVAKVPTKRFSKRNVYAELSYHYPQYTLKQASEMPYRDLTLLLKTARRIEAKRMYDLVQIVAAPKTKKGVGVKKLSNHFKKEAKL